MAIELKAGDRHRCTDCGAKWWAQKRGWIKCSFHPCPKCSAKPEPVECAAVYHGWHPQVLAESRVRYCPYCGEALAKQEG